MVDVANVAEAPRRRGQTAGSSAGDDTGGGGAHRDALWRQPGAYERGKEPSDLSPGDGDNAGHDANGASEPTAAIRPDAHTASERLPDTAIERERPVRRTVGLDRPHMRLAWD